jgi:DNA invertase Pin-like site-specific DNA recombinase
MIFNYIRVSTAVQNTDRQLRDVSCDREYLEKVSAKATNRPELQNMLNNLREDDVVNVHELSRLARNTRDLLDIVDQIIDKGASIHFHKENLRFDVSKKDDAFQKLMLTMLVAISSFERDLMLERQREGIAIAKMNDAYKGRKSVFSDEDILAIKKEFDESTNKAELAREHSITRSYLYKLVKKAA